MFTTKKLPLKVLSMLCATTLSIGAVSANWTVSAEEKVSLTPNNSIKKVEGSVQTDMKNFLDESVVTPLPTTVANDEPISVIVTMSCDSVIDTYLASGSTMSATEYANTQTALSVARSIEKQRNDLISRLNKSNIDFEVGATYDTVLSGFEVVLKASDFDKFNKLLGRDATAIVGEVYEECESEVVENLVEVYDTGIFDSSRSAHKGDGVVVGVLDTGLDYTHTAFTGTFNPTSYGMTISDVADRLNGSRASEYTFGLTAENVYVSSKVPFAYDYADKDPDVLPINSEHGTHVAGIIAGSDDTIVGVAPNAQLAIFKVFSDNQTGARDSWILSALEDAVKVGVDVINMSLGSSCGFSREVDKENKNVIYDAIKAAGISLICAGSNDYNATFGSTKNGSLPLTTNPDSGTVGAPATYDAALSVASVSGVKTPYLSYQDKIIYFNEASTGASKQKNFVNEMLSASGVDTATYEYVTIPGVGRAADYTEDNSFYEGKIVLVRRGIITFEEKVKTALDRKGAAGIIIYNNVSGDISMSVGESTGAVCSISQDDGEMLAESRTGRITLSRDNVAGPFMSGFSSWGPTSDLKIKPEITAHGGDILSAVPGQRYERLSGTSMAAPNQAGVAALIRQYVNEADAFKDLNKVEKLAMTNRLMMSTADIVLNKNGLPYSVRKQGSGLVNMYDAQNTPAYITTYENGVAMDKTKLELGDDPQKTGVYTMSFSITNITNAPVSYDVGAIVQTEGISTTFTNHGGTTSTQDGYALNPASANVTNVRGGTANGNNVTVPAKGQVDVTFKIVLSDADKAYLEQERQVNGKTVKTFANGMYIEGFVTLTPTSSNTEIDLSVPYLSFYGDWDQAPMLDEEIYDTDADEKNLLLSDEDKTMADAAPSKVYASLYSDYISTLGEYYFKQTGANQIPAKKEHNALSNQSNSSDSTTSGIYAVCLGLLRNAKQVVITITDDVTGEVIFSMTESNIRKSSGTSNIYATTVRMDYFVAEHGLKNNTQYTVRAKAYNDYGTHEHQDDVNVRNTFEFPLYIDFEAPLVTGVSYRTEYDKTTKKTKLFADIEVYDNHYAMAGMVGQITKNTDPTSQYMYSYISYGKYFTPIVSGFNTTSTVTMELTDYVNKFKDSAGTDFNSPTNTSTVENNNSFVFSVYDYAMNNAMYEIRLPDEVMNMYFSEESLNLSPNETVQVSDVLKVYPETTWLSTLNFESTNANYAEVVNGVLITKDLPDTMADTGADVTITAIGYTKDGQQVTATLPIHVYGKNESGYKKYTDPIVSKFSVDTYKTLKAFYMMSSNERDIGVTDSTNSFDGVYTLSMYPSESVLLNYTLEAYNKNATVEFSTSRDRVAIVNDKGVITAKAEGSATIYLKVVVDGKTTIYSQSISITVKNPFTLQSIYLMAYRGLGGTVTIPADKGITSIYAYAFASSEYVDKDENDEISEEDPFHIKQQFIGETTIQKVIIPEGVTEIGEYAFAGLTGLEQVVFPTTLKKISLGAFYGCTKLTTLTGLENVQFINKQSFYGCESLKEVNLGGAVAIGYQAFAGCNIINLDLPVSCQSIGYGAFSLNEHMTTARFRAPKLNLDQAAFAGCVELSAITINAVVISADAFNSCTSLRNVTFGKDVAVIGENAFANTKVSFFDLGQNRNFTTTDGGKTLYKNGGTTLALVAPAATFTNNTLDLASTVLTVESGAVAANTSIRTVNGANVTEVGDYAFVACTALRTVNMPKLTTVGAYAFADDRNLATINMEKLTYVGEFGLANTALTAVTLGNEVTLGNYAFAYDTKLTTVMLGNKAQLGEGCFYRDTALTTATFGANSNVGTYTFYANTALKSVALGDGAIIGANAFRGTASLTEIDLSKVIAIGDLAFAGISSSSSNSITVNKLTSVDLSSVTELGEGVFMYNLYLQNVTLGNLTKIPAYTFTECENLPALTLPQTVTEIGDFAFAFTLNMETINLDKVTVFGANAFNDSAVSNVTIGEGAVIGDYAFATDTTLDLTQPALSKLGKLATVNNLDKAVAIGAYAFQFSAIQTADLSAVQSLGDYAFAYGALTNVTLGDELTYLGENPFLACAIPAFAKTTDVEFNGEVIGQTQATTFAISNNVQVVEGVLYKTCPNGLVLVTYPLANDQKIFTVAENTVRIGAKAFMGATLQNVTIASTTKAIGDKAFYACNDLSIVVFLSLNAPILEEEYDTSYSLYTNLPTPGYMAVGGQKVPTLGISDYYMWNYGMNTFYYGANFVNYVGKVDNKLVMVKPSNGLNYNSFIFGQYFGMTIEGAVAADANTLNAINAISALDGVRITNTPAVVALINNARTAYNKVITAEQQALVKNVDTLINAEATLKRIIANQEPVVDPEPEQPEQPSKTGCKSLEESLNVIVFTVILGFGAILLAKSKKKQ